jgi:biofilm PGA synthesis N-glycosyltransferase PgaC
MPVFFDQSGKRWRNVLFSLTALLFAIISGFGWLTPRALSPLWSPSSNRATIYPAALPSNNELKSLPIIGQEGTDSFTRVDLVDRSNGQVNLLDPLSGTRYRAATPDEAQAIGSHQYALEWFGHPADHQLALTFDDGPDELNTPAILDILSEEHVTATFFVIGKNTLKQPDLLDRIIREGHDVGNHTLNHVGFKNGHLRNQEELVGADRLIRAIGGYSTRLFRIPEGDPDHNASAVALAQRLGYINVDMDMDTEDWQYGPGHDIPVPQLDGKGHIVLLHDGGSNRATTIALLRKLIRKAKAQNYSFTTISALMPPAYQSQKASPSLADRATWLAFWSLLVLPGKLITWLYWFGIVTLSTITALYISLALVNHRRQQKKTWDDDYRPRVSVIIAAFNEETVILKTLKALRGSSYPRYEVLVVDDGSEDNTWKMLEVYARKWAKLRIFHQENQGKSAALNYGIAQSRGEIIVTLDADTVFEPQTIGALIRHFIDPAVGAVAGNVKVGNRRNILTAWQSLEYISGISVTRMAEGLLGAIMIVPGACAAWRKLAILEAGGYSEATQAEDCDLTLSVKRLGYRITQENEAVAWTEAPMGVRSLAKQRLRWAFGNLQAFYKHRSMVLRPRYGMLGMLVLPYALLSLIIPLLFMPLTYAAAAVNLANGEWHSVVYFAILVAGIQLATSVVGLIIAREKMWHLLVVPIYRPIYEPLRAYLLYATLFRAARGRLVGWYRPARTNTV